MFVLLLLLFASHISASTFHAPSVDNNNNTTSHAAHRSSGNLEPHSEPAKCWNTSLRERFCSSVEACHKYGDCGGSCHKMSSVMLHNLIVLYGLKEDEPVFADSFHHDPYLGDDGASCGDLARETFQTLTVDGREYYTSSDCNAACSYTCRTVRYTEKLANALNDRDWLGVLLFECDSFPQWLLGLVVGIACTLLGVLIGVGSCCFYIKRRKKTIEKDDLRTGSNTDLRVQTIDVTAPTASDFRLHKARSPPRPSLSKSPGLPVAKKPTGTSILPETPLATRTALPGIDLEDRERAKKPKGNSSLPKTPKRSSQPKTDAEDPETKASAPSLRSPRSGYGSA